VAAATKTAATRAAARAAGGHASRAATAFHLPRAAVTASLSAPPPPLQFEQIRHILDDQMTALQAIEGEATDAMARARATEGLLQQYYAQLSAGID
jgi:hypothetical protein